MKPLTVYLGNIYITPINSQIGRLVGTALLLCFLLFGYVNNARCQTTIVGIRTADAITIGADSKSVLGDGSTATRCKIVQVRDAFSTFAGVPVIPELNFDARDIVRNSFKTNGTIADKVRALERVLEPRLSQVVEQVRVLNVTKFNEWYGVGDHMALQVMIAGTEDGKLVLYSREYTVSTPAELPVVIKPIPRNLIKDLPPGQVDLMLHGEHEAILNDIARSDLSHGFEAERSIRKWITLETIVKPGKVGLPVDIMRLTKGRDCWVEPKTKKDCDDPKIEACKVLPTPKSPVKQPNKRARR